MDEDVTQLLEGHMVMNDHDLNSIPSALLKGGPGSETHEWTHASAVNRHGYFSSRKAHFHNIFV